MRWLVCQFILFLCVAPAAFAYTSPGEPVGYVNDFADVLTDAEEQQLEAQATNIKEETGAEVAIVSVETLGEDTIELYALDLFAEWEIGEAGVDTGVLILFVPGERAVRIEVGYGLESVIPDTRAADIITTELVPAFAQDAYFVGLQAAVERVGQAVTGLSPDHKVQDVSLWKGFVTLFFGVISLLALGGRWCKYAAILVTTLTGLWVYETTLLTGYALIASGIVGMVVTVVCALVHSVGKGGSSGGSSSGRSYSSRPSVGSGRGWGGFGGGRSGGGGASGRW